MGKKITKKQQRFVDEYLIDLNATQAAIRAGYSLKTARSQGQRLLTKEDIKTAVTEGQKNRAKRTEITQDRVLEEIAKLAFFDPQRLFGDDGKFIPVHKLDKEVAAAIGGLDVVTRFEGEDRIVTEKLKIADKRGNLELLGKHLKLFTDKVEHTGKDGGPIDINANITVQKTNDFLAQFTEAGSEETLPEPGQD